MRGALALAVVVWSSCGGDPDPCAEAAGACLAVDVSSSSVRAIDQLELDILYGDRHATTTVQAEGGAVVSLPVVTSIELELTEAIDVGVVAAGKQSGVVLGTGASSARLEPGGRGAISIELADTQDCVVPGLYCGGDKLAGDPDTLYQCNGGGVPLARGRCVYGCVVRPGDDDECRGGGGTCVEGGFYCGGDKVDGDPSTLYRCEGGVGTSPMVCDDGCVVGAPGTDDACR